MEPEVSTFTEEEPEAATQEPLVVSELAVAIEEAAAEPEISADSTVEQGCLRSRGSGMAFAYAVGERLRSSGGVWSSSCLAAG